MDVDTSSQTTLFSQFPNMVVLHYGTDSSVRLNFAEGVSLVECGGPRGRPIDGVGAALTDALKKPLDYPPLAACTTPGDRIVLALDRELPQAAELVATVIGALIDGGVDPDGISVLRPQVEGNPRAEVDPGDDPRCLLPEAVAERVALLTHDPTDREQLGFLARTKADHPILVHRAMHEADLIVPIGLVRGESAGGYFGIHTGIYPTFADADAIGRFRSPKTLANGTDRRQWSDEVDEVAWLLGVHFTIQIVPADGDSVMHVVAGLSESVGRRTVELYRNAWHWPIARPASLVVAAIEGDASQQTWRRLGRTLEVAATLIEDGGSMAVCCDLAETPGPAIQRMVGGDSRREALRSIGRELPADALAAAQLTHAQDRGKVYLLSRLDPPLVESLDVIPLANPEELARLVRLHSSCVVLSHASHVEATLVE